MADTKTFDPKWFALLISALAFGLTSYQACELRKQRENAEGLEAIRTSYQIFGDMTRGEYEHPRQLHLFQTSNATYRRIARVIHGSVKDQSESERLRLRLEEQAMADHLFTLYEELFFNWKQAVGKSAQAEFLQQDLTGYLPSLLCNPRLQWYWSPRGGQLSTNYSSDLLEHYKTNVTPNCGNLRADAGGPFSTDEP
jgi:hypothetical protein